MIGLDIGSTSVRLLQLSSRGSGYRVDHFATEPLGEGVVVDKAVQDVEAAANAITRAIQVSGTRAKSCAIAVSGSAVFTKMISLPANLAEGHGRIGRDRTKFWRIAYASAKEVDTHLRLLTHARAINRSRAEEARARANTPPRPPPGFLGRSRAS